MKKAFQDMLHELGEVNPTHAYYNGSCTSKDTEDLSWSTSFKTMSTQKTSLALEALWKTLFVLYLYMIGTFRVTDVDDRGKVDSSKALDASLVIIESNGIESQEQYTNSRSGNDAHVDDADTRPIYDEEPMAEVQTTVEINIFAKEQQHTEQPEFNNEGEVDQNAEQYHDICPLPANFTDNKTTKLLNQSLESENEKRFAIAALKNELRKITGNSINTKFAKPSILGKLVLHQHRNHLVAIQTTALKSERPRFSKRWFASQVDVNNNLTKPVTPHYFPKGRESAVAKPHHMIAPSSSRYSSNDMVHNHYVTTQTMPIAEHSRNSRNFSDSKHFVCSTCQKCVFSANHDACVTKFLNEVNTRAKVLSNQTTNINKPVEQISVAKKPKRQIPKGHRFSIKETTTVHEKTMSPRSCLRWKPTGRIFKTVGLRWVPTGKIFASSITKVDSEPTHGSNVDISHIHACKQTLDLSAGTSFNGQKQQRIDLSAGGLYNVKQENLRVWLLKKLISQKPVPQCSDLAPQRQEMSVENVTSGLVPQGQKALDYDNSGPVPPRQNVVPIVEKIDSSHQGLDFLFSPLIEEYYTLIHCQAEENNNDQTTNTLFQEDEFINPFCTRVQETGESSSCNIDNTDVHSFQPQNPEMYMFALTVSIVEPKNINDAMADPAWIEAMQEELHQFDRLKV
ncbi:hypothetical protein Tco_1352433 [Tanacetum coccineum]